MSAESVREFYRSQGSKVERERIIKLLETNVNEYMCCNCGMDDLIALIKGEEEISHDS